MSSKHISEMISYNSYMTNYTEIRNRHMVSIQRLVWNILLSHGELVEPWLECQESVVVALIEPVKLLLQIVRGKVEWHSHCIHGEGGIEKLISINAFKPFAQLLQPAPVLLLFRPEVIELILSHKSLLSLIMKLVKFKKPKRPLPCSKCSEFTMMFSDAFLLNRLEPERESTEIKNINWEEALFLS